MTQPSMVVNCPHCGAVNTAGQAFCESCGKALPAIAPSGPRVVAGDAIASTAAGQQLQAEQLEKQAKRAKGALLAVAIITTILAAIVFALVPALQRSAPGGASNPQANLLNSAVPVAMLIVAAVFWGLYIWSRSQPLPAAIVGLVIYGTLIAINVVTTLSLAAKTGQPAGIGVGCIDIVIVLVLAQAISAGVQHRKLMRHSSQFAPQPPPL